MRLVTRSDFDGLACAVLLEELGMIDSYLFVHPKEVQDGNIAVGPHDILANVPYAPGCGLWFDHHSSETERLHIDQTFRYEGASQPAPSCARVIYSYYGGADKLQKHESSGLMPAADKCDSADFTIEDILEPEGWVLLSFLLDARTGLERFGGYSVDHHGLMKKLITYCKTMDIDTILQQPEVRERAELYSTQELAYEAMVRENSHTEHNVIVMDLRRVDEILSGNRFVEYAIYPFQNVSVRTFWGRGRKNVVISAGHSIIEPSCTADIGRLMLSYGGGGHKKVGTCQVPAQQADRALEDIINQLRQDI